MEVCDPGSRRRSNHLAQSLLNTDHYGPTRDYNPTRPPPHPRDLHAPSNMATAALISPNTPYYPHHTTPYSSDAYGADQAPPPPAPGMISPVEIRRTSDEHDMPSHRQSLPSIQEVIGHNAPSPYPPPSAPQNMPQPSLPSPFSSTASSRPFAAENAGDRQPSPRGLHHQASSSALYNPRPDPIAAFPNPLRPQLSGRSSQPALVHPSPPPGSEYTQGGLPPAAPSAHHPQQQLPHAQSQPHHLQQEHQTSPHAPYHHHLPAHRDPRASHDDHPPPQNNAYPHASSHASSYPPQPPVIQQQLPPPPGQYPASPRNSGPSSLPSPFEAHQQNPLPETPQDYNRSRTRYDQAVNRHFEAWSYGEYLARIGSNARTIYNFAEAFGSIAREEHGPQPIPGRMPGDREVCEMISNAEWLKTMLENLRGMVQQTVVNEQGLGGSRQKPANYEDMDAPMYNEPMAAKPYGLNEVKKRRGRAAPPGRCHSCNRIDTPEWRRGPDGARTLCNACGLHYAKLERKKQLESRQMRLKHPDERH